MSCYFRHMKDVLEEAGIEVSQKNKKKIDEIVHRLVGVEYKDCSLAWKAFKERIKSDEKARNRFVADLKKRLKDL